MVIGAIFYFFCSSSSNNDIIIAIKKIKNIISFPPIGKTKTRVGGVLKFDFSN
jgi:hypothetical protein